METLTFPATAPGFDTGSGAVDCHIHIVGAQSEYPFTAKRSYAVPPATIADYERVASVLGIDHAVVIQPSFYGTDNRCLIDTLEAVGPRWRGVAVVDGQTSDREMARLSDVGCCGTRLNLVSTGGPTDGEVGTIVERTLSIIAGSGWHLQIFTQPCNLRTIADIQSRTETPIIIDHIGFADLDRDDLLAPDGDVATLQRICEAGGYVKLSGIYRLCDDPFDPRLAAIAQALFAAVPDQLVWASDWPHTPGHQGRPSPDTTLMPYRGLDTGRLLAPVATWLPDGDDRRRLLVENPEKLYGLAAASAA